MKLLLACAALFFLSSCADPKSASPVATKRVALDVKAAVGEKLLLSWQPQTAINAYHVFYQNNGVAREIDSVQKTDPDFANPKQIIDSTNMETWPAKGGQACFYVVAEANGVLSDASDQACVTMQ